MPHVWSEALLVLLGYELYGPQLNEIDVSPRAEVAEDGDAPIDGDTPTADGDLPQVDGDVTPDIRKTCHQECQCNQPLTSGATWWLVLTIGLLVIWLGRRRVRD
jgi:hypothetical protein